MTTAVRVGAHVRSVIDSDGAVILDLKHGRYFSLNGMGVAVWRRLEAGITPAAIEAEFAARYVTASGIDRDVAVFVDSLCRAELIVASE
jgi:hypothetical protein